MTSCAGRPAFTDLRSTRPMWRGAPAQPVSLFPMLRATAAIALSIGLWLAGVRVILSAQSAAVERLPDDWRRQAPDDYAALAALRVGDLLAEAPRLLTPLAAGAGFFFLLALVEVALAVQVGFCLVLAGYWTAGRVRDERRERERYREAHGLAPLPANRPLVLRYRAGLFIAWLGLLFLGLAIARAAAGLVA